MMKKGLYWCIRWYTTLSRVNTRFQESIYSENIYQEVLNTSINVEGKKEIITRNSIGIAKCKNVVLYSDDQLSVIGTWKLWPSPTINYKICLLL